MCAYVYMYTIILCLFSAMGRASNGILLRICIKEMLADQDTPWPIRLSMSISSLQTFQK